MNEISAIVVQSEMFRMRIAVNKCKESNHWKWTLSNWAICILGKRKSRRPMVGSKNVF